MTYPDGTAAKIIDVALGEVGYIEEPENVTKYGEYMKANGLAWCGSFVNWCAHNAGVKLPSMVSTALGAHRLKEVSRWHETPEKGDLAFFDFPHDGVDRISHIGIVANVLDGSVVTIEGNTAPAGGDQRNGGMVMIKTRTYGKGSSIVGFGRPKYVPYKGDYPKIEAGEEAVKPKKKWSKKSAKSK